MKPQKRQNTDILIVTATTYLLHRENDFCPLTTAYDLLNVALVNTKDDEELALTLNARGSSQRETSRHGNHHTVRIFRTVAAQGLAAGESLQREGVLGCDEQKQDSPTGHTALHRCRGRGTLLRMD